MSLVCALVLLAAQSATLRNSLFVDGLLIGSYESGKWIKSEKPVSATNVPARQLLLMSSIPAKPIQRVAWEEIPDGNFIDETPNPPRVLWTGAIPSYPRPIRSQNPNQMVYIESVNRALQRIRRGNYPIQITKLIRVDLDGDGVVASYACRISMNLSAARGSGFLSGWTSSATFLNARRICSREALRGTPRI